MVIIIAIKIMVGIKIMAGIMVLAGDDDKNIEGSSTIVKQ
jgi:hypothetical protein